MGEDPRTNEHYCLMYERLVPQHEWVEHSRHHFTFDLDLSRWQDLLRRMDAETLQELDVVGRMERARMEESTRAAEKQQVSRKIINIYPHLRAKMSEDEMIQMAAAAVPNLSPTVVRCMTKAVRLVNHKINDELRWKNKPPILQPESRPGRAETATRLTGAVESVRLTEETGNRNPIGTELRYYIYELAAEEIRSIPDEPSVSDLPPLPPPPREISVDELRRRNLLQKKDQRATEAVTCPTETTTHHNRL